MKKILTVILDGFGYREDEFGNAIKMAKMNTFDCLWQKYPHALLNASGEAIGLNKNQIGNSEIGHMTIGAGRVLKQKGTLVNDFFKNLDLTNKNVEKLLTEKDKDIHIIGMCSDKKDHANIDDFINMYKLLLDNNFKKIHFHLITDGNNSDTHESMKYINNISKLIKENRVGDIASVCGKYYALDKDENWDRTKTYYNLITSGVGVKTLSIENAINDGHKKGLTDEFIKPIITSNNIIKNGDVLIWMNYRANRSQQILQALVNFESFNEFEVKDMKDLNVYTFFNVDKKIKTYNLIENSQIKNTLGLYLSELDFTQARIAENEKFSYVTRFFDCGYEGKINKCDKFNIPSQEVLTYDLKPEMSCVDVTKKVISAMDNDYDFILVNYANPDVVGRTGNIEATIKACVAIDICLNKIVEKAEENFYTVIITSDHGNAEEMINEDNTLCMTNTLAKVPFIICDEKVKLESEGSLANVAPTILDYMDIAIPKEMEETESILIHE